MNFSEFLEQCITDCIEGDGPDADLHRSARAQREQSCNAPECCCDKCWAKLNEVQP